MEQRQERSAGVVKFFSELKGFGFILPDVGGPEVFVHRADLSKTIMTLKQRQRVTYLLIRTDKGNKALDVRAEATFHVRLNNAR